MVTLLFRFLLAVFLSSMTASFASQPTMSTFIFGKMTRNPSTQQEQVSPYILQSHDKDLGWSRVPIISDLPKNLRDVHIFNAKCYGNTCFAVGKYQTRDDKHFTFLLSSHDVGNTWRWDNRITKNKPALGGLQDITCSDNFCAVVGWGEKSIYYSYDRGNTWQSVEYVDKVPRQDTGHMVQSVSCTKDTCVSVGNRVLVINRELTNLPAIVVGENNLQTWAYKDIKGFQKWFSKVTLAHLGRVTCFNDTCIAMGDYQEHKSSRNLALMVQSQDRGKTWALAKKISDVPGDIEFADPNHISCTETMCAVAGGTSFKRQGGIGLFPLIMTTYDRGVTWKMITQINQLPGKGDIFINGIHCSKNNCVIIGRHSVLINNEYKHSMVWIVSNDNGRTWRYVSKDASASNPKFESELTAINCKDKVCTTVGYLHKVIESDKSHYYSIPLILNSDDGGNTWTILDNMRLPSLPNNSSVELDTMTH